MKKIAVLFLFLILLAGCTTQKQDKNNTSTTEPLKTIKSSDNIMDDLSSTIKSLFE